MNNSQTIIPCLGFSKGAEDAAEYYVSVFNEVFKGRKDESKILKTSYFGEELVKAISFLPEDIRPGTLGSVLAVSFTLNGQRLLAINGGSSFKFTEGMSLYVECDIQDEIDALMEKLSADKEYEQCGWLKDKWGVYWQVVPKMMREILEGTNIEAQQRTMVALMNMKKLDIEQLKAAFEGR